MALPKNDPRCVLGSELNVEDGPEKQDCGCSEAQRVSAQKLVLACVCGGHSCNGRLLQGLSELLDVLPGTKAPTAAQILLEDSKQP